MNVHSRVPLTECAQVIGKQFVGVRWFDVKKQGEENPQVPIEVGGQRGCTISSSRIARSYASATMPSNGYVRCGELSLSLNRRWGREAR